MNPIGKISQLLPTTTAKIAASLVVPLAYAPFLLPPFLFEWLQPTKDSQLWLVQLLLATGTSLILSLIVTFSILYHCYHKSINLKEAMEKAEERLRNARKP
jgi:hypothetical protein